MARYFFGNTLAAFKRTSPAILESTTAGRFDSTYVANAILVPSSVDYIETMPFIDASSTTTLWTHAEFYYGGLAVSSTLFAWVNSSGVVVAKIATNGAGTLQFSYWTGAAFTVLGASVATPTANTLIRWDIKLTAGVSGTVDIYAAGTNIFSGSGMNAAVTNFAAVRFTNINQTFWSQMLGADFDTRDSRYIQKLANAEGTNVGGSGAYTDVNEVTLDDGTAITLPATGNKHTLTKAAITLPAGFQIDALCVGARCRVAGGVVTDAKAVTRSAGTDYLSAVLAPAAAYEPRGQYWATDPATSAAWTKANFDAAEFGLQAA